MLVVTDVCVPWLILCGVLSVMGLDIEQQRYDNTTHAISMLENVLDTINDKVRPNVYGKPLRVKVDFYIQSISSIDEVEMDFHVDTFFRQRWIDERLRFTNQTRPIIVPAKFVDRFWVPDIYFPNEKEAYLHTVVVPNEVIKVFPDGLVRHSSRLTLKLSCPMGLLHFPLDYQNCYIKVSSYTYDVQDVVLEWLSDDPIEINKHELTLPQFEYLGNVPGRCDEVLKTGTFPCLKVVFSFKRLRGYYYLQTYIPSVLIVILSWISFWINKEAVPARITLGVTTVLTMTTQLSSSRSTQMKVSYPKAIDVWYSFCMILVFGALIEYAIVNVLTRAKAKLVQETEQIVHSPREGDKPVETVVEINDTNQAHTSTAGPPKSQKTHTSRITQQMYIVKRRVLVPVESYAQTCCGHLSPEGVDKCARIIFPAAFILFNISYWIVYSQPVVFFSHVFV